MLEEQCTQHLEVLWSHSSVAKVIEEIPLDVVGYLHLITTIYPGLIPLNSAPYCQLLSSGITNNLRL
jgi:hypothetical protein